MATTSFQGVTRSYGGGKKKNVAPGVLVMSVTVAGDAAADGTSDAARMRVGRSATVGKLFVLPKGAIMLTCMSLGGALAGKVEIGSAASTAGFVLAADTNTIGTVNTLLSRPLITSVGLAADTQVTLKQAASAPTGTAEFAITYTVADNGKDGSIQ